MWIDIRPCERVDDYVAKHLHNRTARAKASTTVTDVDVMCDEMNMLPELCNKLITCYTIYKEHMAVLRLARNAGSHIRRTIGRLRIRAPGVSFQRHAS